MPLARASISVRQLPTSCSIGCRARPSKIVVAIMMPADACWVSTRYAPSSPATEFTMMKGAEIPAIAATARAVALSVAVVSPGKMRSKFQSVSPGSISIALFRNAQWSVASNGRETGSSLWVNRNGQGNQEVADGVQSLALTYRQFAGGNPAAYVNNPSDFNYVDGVRLGVAIRAPSPQEVGGGTAWITRNASATVGVRSRSL